ncbi:MAG TPA: helix-turn-helix transcriptional regulator, partial [Firmicutes bacterium]|nr:helix-turn-helix transcriptional regulator [Bacillota bacterium]
MAKARQYDTKSLYFSERITEAMAGIFKYPLTIVEAPMGYGKTTAVREYLKDCGATVLWQTLADDSASGFWRGFCRLLKKIDLGCAEKLAELGVPNDSIFMDTALALIADIAFAERTVIVFDDYHLLSSKSIEQFIELLMKTTPSDLHIVIISRAAFGENTAELSLKGFCHHIDKSNFEFTQDEIAVYYKLCGISLRPEEVAELYAYTEGWISALYLSLLRFVRDGRVERQANLPELIEKAVYQQCPAEVKEFLLNICVFDSFTFAQAQAIWPQDNVETIVNYLMDNNAFIKYDPYNKTYQMHNIFTGYLREILERQGAKKQREALLAAGGWYLSSGDYIHAMDAFYQAGDFAQLLVAFEMDNGSSINVEDKEKVIGYFADCPEAIQIKYPIACLTYARKMFSFNERTIYAAQCLKAGEYIAAVQDEKTKKQLLGEYELIKSFMKYNNIRGMAEHQGKAYELLDGPSKLFDDNKNFWTYGSPSVLYMFYRESGML